MANEDRGSLPRLSASYGRALTGRKPKATAATGLPTLASSVRGWRVDTARLAEYRAVVGSSAELPITFPQVPLMSLTMDLLTRRTFPLRAMGLIHRASAIRVLDEIDPDEPWDLRASNSAARHVRSGIEFDVCTEVSIAGRVRWTSQDVYLSRSRAASGSQASQLPELDSEGPWTGQDQLSADQGTARAFARVTGDLNPIHLHRLGARAFGLPGAIAHGWWTAGRCAAQLAADEAGAGREYDIVFRRLVTLPSQPLLRSRAGIDFVLVQHEGGSETDEVLVVGRLRG